MTSQNQSKRLTRTFVRFQNNPSSIRYASAAIISTIVALVLVGALLVRIFDSSQYDTFGEALWFTLQTVTTVGYGDNPPTSGGGRAVASVVMLVSTGLVAVITAVVTSMFIRSISQDERSAENQETGDALARIESRLTEAHERLSSIERATTSTSSEHRD